MTAPLPPERLAEAIKRRLWLASPTLKRRATAAEVADIAAGLADLFAEQAAEVDRLRAQVAVAWDEGEEAGRENADDGYPDPLIENPYRAVLASGDER